MHWPGNKGRLASDMSGCGFTLVEILLVLVITAVLATIAYPSYVETVRKARRAEGRAALLQLMQQQERYYSQNSSYIVFSSASTDANEQKFKWYSGDAAATSAYEISGAACSDDLIRNCVVLTARPGTAKVNPAYADSLCGELSLTSSGEKKASGSASHCWQ